MGTAEPGVDHNGLSGDSLIAAKQKLGVGVLKNKQQLIHALEKAAGQELAEKATQEAVNAALQKSKVFIEEQVGKVVLPAGPDQFAEFMASVHDAEVALAMGTGLPQEYLEFMAKELALKKKVFQDQLAAMNAARLKDLVLAAGYQAHQAKYGKQKPHPAAAPSSPKTPSTPPAWEPAPSPVHVEVFGRRVGNAARVGRRGALRQLQHDGGDRPGQGRAREGGQI